ncbi:MoaD/ThiS family protein [Anatilimnocola floriformis]|uniref:MoaD/ThiS family protein n=1 Tax=Anatilimnocola floriformis TaxID=2948575 RepID=UPI0020C3A61C|nr:MoaD/ThiS family protein [Anatilimnocola floriformis]
MATIFIPAQLRSLTSGSNTVVLPAANVGEAIELLEQSYPGIRARLCQGNDLLPGFQLSIDHRFTRQGLSAELAPDSEVHFLPVIGGG